MLFRQAMLRVAGLPAVQEFVTRGRAMRGVVRRYVAGESLDEAVAAARGLNAAGMRATLNCLGEDVLDRAAAERARGEYLELLEAIARHGLDANISVKPTQLGLAFDRRLTARNLAALADRAAELGSFVRIDMESSAYTQATLDLFYELFDRQPSVGVVIQAYLYRSAADVEELIRRGARVRLCKGAYREPPSLAYQRKAEVDDSYRRLSARLLEAGTFPALATHDTRMVHHARRFAAARRIGADRYEFQMLYGVRRDLQRRIVAHGYGLRVYVPYGKDWYPYLTRRLAERPANLIFLVNSVLAERGRRPS